MEFQGRAALGGVWSFVAVFSLLLQAAVEEVANVSLVGSACEVISAACASTRERHPCLRSVCDAAERGMQSCVQPVLATLEPHGKSLGGVWLLPHLGAALG